MGSDCLALASAIPSGAARGVNPANRALLFTAASSQYALGTGLDITATPITLACCVKFTSTALMSALSLGSATDGDLYIAVEVQNGAGQVRSHDGTPLNLTRTGASGLNDDAWHLLVGVWNGGVMKISVDGAAFTPTTAHGIIDFERVVAGAYGDLSPAQPFDGAIDEPMFFNEALTATDSSELWNGGNVLLARDLISGKSALTSARKPFHAWPLDSNRPGGAGADVGTTGGTTLTLTNGPVDTPGV